MKPSNIRPLKYQEQRVGDYKQLQRAPLLNREAVRDLVLKETQRQSAGEFRDHNLSRISFDHIERRLEKMIQAEIAHALAEQRDEQSKGDQP